ncbi:HlyD family secretion protein [Bacteroides heparinolyticus]|uniref:HlyD family secretion protein n=1 Tax=Prevotella heparinolytica TaxID=28113 RepID=UPI0035A05C91
MKTTLFFALGITFLLSSCADDKNIYDASGVFEATEVMVSAREMGELIRFNVQEGQNVAANEFLGCIDTTQLHLKKQQLLASLQSVGSKHFNIGRQVAATRQQIANLRKEQNRYESLVRANAGNQKQLDDIIAQIALLEKQLAAQTENLENSNNSVTGEALGLEAQVAQLEDQIKKSIIVSPIDGVVLVKYAEQGELAAQGRALFKVADIANMVLRAYITADQLTTLKVGQSVKVYADQGTEDRKEYEGKIVWISDKAEFTPKTIQTRNERANLVYAVKIAVSNDGLIKKGMYGEIKIN